MATPTPLILLMTHRVILLTRKDGLVIISAPEVTTSHHYANPPQEQSKASVSVEMRLSPREKSVVTNRMTRAIERVQQENGGRPVDHFKGISDRDILEKRAELIARKNQENVSFDVVYKWEMMLADEIPCLASYYRHTKELI